MTSEADNGKRAPRLLVILLGLYLLVVVILAISLAIGTWPHCTADTAGAAAAPAAGPGQCSEALRLSVPLIGSVSIPGGVEARYFYIAICFGAIGSLIHVLTSFADYVGNRKLYLSWFWWLILRTPIGISLAVVFYVVIRAGFLTTASSGTAAPMNPYGVAAVSAMVGMFSKQATDKLNEVFTTLFKTDADKKRGDKLDRDGVPQIAATTPKFLTAASPGQTLTVTGSGFANGMKVQIKGQAIDKIFDATEVTEKSLKVEIAGLTLVAGQGVELVVFDPNVATAKSKAFALEVQ